MVETAKPAPEYLLKQIREVITDPAKLAWVATLTEDEARAVTAYRGSTTPEQFALLKTRPELEILQIIYVNHLMDWASERSEAIQAQIDEFIDSPTFVDYPDFLHDEAITKAIKYELINDHYQHFERLREYGLDILGARIGESGEVEVLLTHHQVLTIFEGGMMGGPTNVPIDQQEYQVPPEIIIAYLKRDPQISMHGGESTDLYLAMKAPYTSYQRSGYIEVVLPKNVV